MTTDEFDRLVQIGFGVRLAQPQAAGLNHAIRDLTAALSEAQAREAALKGEVERLTKALASEEEISRAFSRSARQLEEERDALRREKDDLLDTKPRRDRMFDAEAWDGAMDALGKMTSERDDAVQRAEAWEEDARRYCQNADHHREKREAAESMLAAAVKRAEEAEAAYVRLSAEHDTLAARRWRNDFNDMKARAEDFEAMAHVATRRASRAESRLALAERVVEAAVALLEVVDEWAGTRRQLREFRAAVAEYRKAVGK